MECPNCGQKTAGDFCQWCGYPIMKGKPVRKQKEKKAAESAAKEKAKRVAEEEAKRAEERTKKGAEGILTEQYERNWKNYYEILQVSPNAEPSVITAAYRRLAQAYHPDTAKDPKASARMADINEAYEVLSNPVRRSEYDHAYRVKYPAEEAESEAPTEDEVLIGLMRFAAEQAAKGKKRSQVADELTRQGVPYDVAAQIVQRVFEYRSELKRKEGGKAIGCGLLMLIVGGIITGVTYAAASGGGIYIVTTGLFIGGGITLIVGLYKWLTS